MDSRYLRSLIAIVDEGSIAEAARVEGLTSAAVGQRIQALERDIGFELLSRTGHAARPTQACIALLPRARRIVREVALLPGDADPLGLTGTLRVGAISTALTGVLPAALRALTREAPGVKPIIVPGTSRDLYQALQAQLLDAAIVVAPPFALPKRLRTTRVSTEPLVFLSPQALSADMQTLLRDAPYIRYDPEAWGGRLAARYLEDRRLAPTVLCDLDALEAIAMLVADGVGVSLVPHWSGLERLSGDCRITSVDDTRYQREVILLTSVDHQRPAMLDALRQAIAQKPAR